MLNNYRHYNKVKTAIVLLLLLIFLCPLQVQAKKKKTIPVDLPTPKYKIVKYNNPPGSKNINIHKLVNQKLMNLNNVISPDGLKMVYTEVYFYPNSNQTSSALFLINLNSNLSPVQRILKSSIADKIQLSLLRSGMNAVDNQILRTLTVVDWSSDGKKLLIKEKIGENQRNRWVTNLWTYDFVTGKTTRFDEIRAAIKYYWKNKKQIYLDDYKWDILPIGWDLYNPDRAIVYAYGMYKDNKIFLGAWSVDTVNGITLLLSLTKNDYEVSQNGLELIIE